MSDDEVTETYAWTDSEGGGIDAEPTNAPAVLAEMTGRPESEFRADDYPMPDLEDLELVEAGGDDDAE